MWTRPEQSMPLLGHAAPEVRRPEVGARHVDRRPLGVRRQRPVALFELPPHGSSRDTRRPSRRAPSRPGAPRPAAARPGAPASPARRRRRARRARARRRRRTSCGVPLDLRLQHRLDARPVVVEHRRTTRNPGSSPATPCACGRSPRTRPPMPSRAPRTRRLRASVLNSTRIRPAVSNALRSRRYFVSTFAPVPHCARSSHVQPISARRWNGSMFR